MNTLTYRSFYRRNLPHYQPPGATLFVTFRLKGSIPQAILDELFAEREKVERRLSQVSDLQARERMAALEDRRFFGKWDRILDTVSDGPKWLADDRIAQLVSESLHYRDGRVYTLLAFCVMPNHVHLVCVPLVHQNGTYQSLPAILHSLKRYTAYEANRILGRKGAFWQPESYDHVVRDEEELARVLKYVLDNPVKARLVGAQSDWPWSYLRAE